MKPGRQLCRVEELAETGARGVDLEDSEGRLLPLVIVRGDDGLRCYVNVCPHQGTPLETFPDRFLDQHGRHLVCSTHGARFRVSDGVCVVGPCKGARLIAFPVRCEGGSVVSA
ncbi:MAG: Rieske 2Fe-2S domain-containing protein [Hyphomicrobiaceae bacterium]|nr:Rieske 2Fe-2S domain-containing protein [Hyphomicrobiaceae bacterium]